MHDVLKMQNNGAVGGGTFGKLQWANASFLSEDVAYNFTMTAKVVPNKATKFH